MPPRGYLVDQSFYEEYKRIVRKVDSIKGDGVTNTRECILIRQTATAGPTRIVDRGAARRAWVIVKRNGGSAGTKTTACTFGYDLYDAADTGFTTPLNVSGPVQPLCSRARILNGPTTAAPDGSYATVIYDTDGVIQLFDLPESLVQNNCTEPE